MATTLAELLVKIGADLKDFNKGMEQVERGLKKTMGSSAMEASQTVVTAMSLAGAAMIGLGAASIKLAAELEQEQIAFTTLLGSAEKADAFLKQMEEFAKRTPFQFNDLLTASQRLLAVGFSAQQVQPMLTVIGDAVSGLGKGAEGLQEVVNVFARMSTQGRVTARDMRSLAELGLPSWQLLAKEMGISIPEAMQKAKDGTINAAQAIPTMLQGMNEKFGGLMDKQSHSLLGMWTNTKDSLEHTGKLIGTSLMNSLDLKAHLGKLNAALEEFTKNLDHGGLKEALSKLIPPELQRNIAIVAGAIMGAMVPALGIMALDAAAAIVPLLPFIAAGAALAAVALVIAKNWDNWAVKLATVLAIVGTAVILFDKVQLGLKIWSAMTKALTLVQAALNFVLSANPIGIIILSIAGLIAVGVLLYKNWDTVKRVALEVWGSLKAVVLNAVAALVDAYGHFIGIFSADKQAQAQAAADSLRAQAEGERNLVNERQSAYDADVAAQERAQFRKSEHASDSNAAQEESDADKLKKALAGMKAEGEGAENLKTQKTAYLAEFDNAFAQAHEKATIEFDRNVQDQTETFKRGQEDQLKDLERAQAKAKTAFERAQQERLDTFVDGQEKEKVALERAQQDKLTTLERAQQDAKITYERGLQEQLDAFKDTQAKEKTEYDRHEQGLLQKFKDRQSDELETLRKTQDAERALVDKKFADQISALKAQQDAIKDQTEAEQAAKRREELLKNVQKAEDALAKAKAKGDPAQIAAAQEQLATATENRLAYETDLKRKAQLQQLQDQMDALRTSKDAELKTLKDRQDNDKNAAQERQKTALTAYERELADDKAHWEETQSQHLKQKETEIAADKLDYDRKQADAKKRFERKQADDKAAFDEQQATHKKQFALEQADQLKDFDDKQAIAKKAFERQQTDAMEDWNRAQQDRKVRFKQEIEDLKLSFREKLGAQEQFVRDWNAGAANLASMVAPVAQVPVPVPASAPAQSPAQPAPIPGTLTGTPNPNGVQLWDPAHPPAVNPPSKAPPTGGKSGGGGGGAKRMAVGGVVTRSTFAEIGEAGPEAVTPLDWLERRMTAFAARIVSGMAGLSGAVTPGPAMSGAGAGGGNMMNLTLEMDGRRVADIIVPYIPDTLRRKVGVKT